MIDNTETGNFQWPVVPRVGDYVEPDHSGEYRVEKVAHMMRRDAAKTIVLYVVKEGGKKPSVYEERGLRTL